MKAAAARLMTYWMAEVAVQKLDTNDDQTRILVCMFFILHILVHMLCINGKNMLLIGMHLLLRDVLLTFLGLTEMYAIFAAYGTLGQHIIMNVCVFSYLLVILIWPVLAIFQAIAGYRSSRPFRSSSGPGKGLHDLQKCF